MHMGLSHLGFKKMFSGFDTNGKITFSILIFILNILQTLAKMISNPNKVMFAF